MKLRDLTGQRFGKLVVRNRAPDKTLPSGYKQVMWDCDCDCGGFSTVSSKNLLYAKYPTRSCGCGMNQIRNNLVGQRFGRLFVSEKIKGKIMKNGYEQQTYYCICDCGKEIPVSYSALVNGNTTSCGCYAKEVLIKRNTTHGMSKTKLYIVWKEMIHRCEKESDKSYKFYGARGVRVCDEWRKNFENFHKWAVQNGYKEGLEIDRINTFGIYEPTNCRWTTRIQQMNNMRSNRSLKIKGTTKTIAEWARLFNINQETLRSRIEAGWDSISALTAPINYRYKKKGEFKDGEKLFSAIV